MSDKETKRGHEREPNVGEALADLLKTHRAARHEAETNGPKWVKDRSATLPDHAKRDVLAYVKELEKDGIQDQGVLAKYAEERIIAFEQTYQDLRFTVGKGERMLNKAYAKEQAITWLKELLDGEPKPEDLKRVAVLNFDANGLKGVNDLSVSHENGTEYLRRVAEVLRDPSSETTLWLKAQGIDEILPVTAGGGDEYSIAIRSGKPIAPEVIREAVARFEESVSRVDISDLLDFNEPDVRLRYLGFSRKEYDLKSANEKKAIDVRATKEIPRNFKMQASVAGGGASLYDGFLTALRNETKPLAEEDAYGQKLGKIMGGMWDAADAWADENKKAFKAGLAESSDAIDRFYSKVLLRTTEARVLEEKINTMTLQLKKREILDREMAELDKLLEEGLVSAKEYVATKKRKQVELDNSVLY